jgi:hypothetical protein
VPGYRRLFFPDLDFGYSFNGEFFFAVLMIVLFAGSCLLVRRLKERSLCWQAGLPLCILTGIITLLMVIYTFYEPSSPVFRVLLNAVVGAILGYAALPACAAYFLYHWKQTCGGVSGRDVLITSAIGIIGLGFLLAVLVYMITYIPPPSSADHDNFLNFTPADMLILLFGLFYGAVLLPVVGLIFLVRGLEYRKLSTGSG